MYVSPLSLTWLSIPPFNLHFLNSVLFACKKLVRYYFAQQLSSDAPIFFGDFIADYPLIAIYDLVSPRNFSWRANLRSELGYWLSLENRRALPIPEQTARATKI